MAKLDAAQRNKLKSSQFAGPDRSYPIENASHARDALARASEMHNQGRLSDSEYAKIRARAKSKLGE